MRAWAFVAVLALILAAYSGLHYYTYRKFRSLFGAHRTVLIALLAALWLSLFVVELLTHGNAAPRIATPLAWIAYTWMGWVFLFFSLSAPIDALTGLARYARFPQLRATLNTPARTVIVALAALGVAGYGYVAAQRYTVQHVTLSSPKLATPVRIVHLTDLHLGLLTSPRRIEHMVTDINALRPDVIVLTGDLVDMQLDHLDGLSDRLARLSARLGKYAVYGNHEAFAGLDASRAFIERAGFTLLSNAGITPDHALNIVGVDDPAVENRVTDTALDEATVLAPYENGRFTVLLKHQPLVAPESVGRFDLQLSGHTHGGQIFPFRALTHLIYRAPFGLSEIAPGQWLYVSRGAGTWGPPLRVLAAAEITVFELTPPIQPQRDRREHDR